MYLKSLHLENIACFEELDLDFTDENGEPCKWIVLLGENGTGKSSILLSIAAICNNRDIADKLVVYEKAARISSLGVGHKYDIALGMEGGGFHLSIYYTFENGFLRKQETDFNVCINSDFYKGYFIAAYGWKRKSAMGMNLDLNLSKKDSVLSLLENDSKITSLKAWIISLDYDVLKKKSAWLNMLLDSDGHDAESISLVEDIYIISLQRFRTVMNIICDVITGNIEFVGVNDDRDVIFNFNGIKIKIENLSDGYQSAMSWISDILRRIFEEFPEIGDNISEATGVILVDEIDLHLHPRWQRNIIRKIRNIFPNLQFIVTSHSPFIAQDMTEKDKIIVLTRDGDKVTARQETGFVKGWRADQILTSWLFGLETTRDEEIESLEKERRLGLQQDEQKLLTDAERKDLDRVTKELEEMRSSDVAPDRQKLEAAAALVMELMSKTL